MDFGSTQIPFGRRRALSLAAAPRAPIWWRGYLERLRARSALSARLFVGLEISRQ